MVVNSRVDNFQFPSGFRWGAATSSHQVEGDNSNNDWWAWEQLPGRIVHGQNSGQACGWWAGRAEEDFDRAASTGQNAHRLSVEWSRVEPRPGAWDEDAIDRYRQLVHGLRARGIEPMVTLHHFTNPVWLAEKDGWNSDAAPGLFRRYVEKIVEALRDDVDLWCTVNEPNVYSYCAYLQGSFPPGERSLSRAFRSLSNLVKAHAAAYHTIHELQPNARVGFAINMRLFDPATSASPLDKAMAWFHNRYYNDVFPMATLDGRIRLPFRREIVPYAAGTMDFLGVNYYTRDLVSFAPWPREGFSRRSSLPGAVISDGGYGEIYPEGLLRAVRWAARFGRPIFITENGVPDAADLHRPRFLVTHIHQLWKALRAQMPVLGYYYWTLVDNFEWERGWTQRFGLWSLDPQTQERILRPGGEVYAAVCTANALSMELVERHAPELL